MFDYFIILEISCGFYVILFLRCFCICSFVFISVCSFYFVGDVGGFEFLFFSYWSEIIIFFLVYLRRREFFEFINLNRFGIVVILLRFNEFFNSSFFIGCF